MTQSSNIINSWSLISFAKLMGPKMQVGEFTNNQTNEDFTSCIFTDAQGTKTFVAFSRNLGVLTPAEIVKLKDQLQVVQLESGNYCLCKQGQNHWLDVDLGI